MPASHGCLFLYQKLIDKDRTWPPDISEKPNHPKEISNSFETVSDHIGQLLIILYPPKNRQHCWINPTLSKTLCVSETMSAPNPGCDPNPLKHKEIQPSIESLSPFRRKPILKNLFIACPITMKDRVYPMSETTWNPILVKDLFSTQPQKDPNSGRPPEWLFSYHPY